MLARSPKNLAPETPKSILSMTLIDTTTSKEYPPWKKSTLTIRHAF